MKPPLRPPVRVTQRFAPPTHYGVDYSVVVGTPVYAAIDGVAYGGNQGTTGFGRYVRIEDGNGLYVYTAHLSAVHVGDLDEVQAGDQIGLSGNTGNSTGPHLHFEVRRGSRLQACAVDPEPMIDWTEDAPVTVTSKLGLHFQQLPPWHKDVVNGGNIAWVKMIDPSGPYPYTRRVNVIGRLWIGGDAVEQAMINDREAGAERYFAECLPRYRAAPWVGVWEGPNEPRPFWDGMQALAVFSKRWAELMHGAGLTCTIGNWSVGWPEPGSVQLLRDAFEETDYWSVHEYSQPTMQTDESWLCLRYRRTVYELRAAGIRVPPLLITECGIDGGAVTPARQWESNPGKGWKTYTDRIGYQKQLAWYNAELCKDDYVVCATPFVSGPAADWTDFDVDAPLAQWISDTHDAPPVPEPLPNDEQGPPAILAQKARYWTEEMQRCFEAGKLERAQVIRLSLIDLLYRLERDLT